MKKFFYDKPGKSELTLQRGTYKFECWGASGGCSQAQCSRGTYVSGYIFLLESTKFYLFVGEKGKVKGTTQTFNGGGSAFYNRVETADSRLSYSSSGGGATDIRLVDGSWDTFESLKSRIMVAGGGGGETNYISISANYGNAKKGGNAGFIKGESGSYSQCVGCSQNAYTDAGGGTQTSGGMGGASFASNSGSFGKGGISNKAIAHDNYPASGGGGGYFGGGAGYVTSDCLGAGAGGSSFVSGHPSCSAIASDFTESNKKFSGFVHYSGLSFQKIAHKEGIGTFKYPNGLDASDGAIRITLINSFLCTRNCNNKNRLSISFIISLVS